MVRKNVVLFWVFVSLAVFGMVVEYFGLGTHSLRTASVGLAINIAFCFAACLTVFFADENL